MLGIVRPDLPRLVEFSDALSTSLRSGVVTNGGPKLVEFEGALSRYLHADVAATCNGQTALMLMLAAAQVGGGEVICPSFTFSGTPAAIRWAGATPVFVDVDPETWTIDPHLVLDAITDKTKAVLGVDVYGMCCDYDGLEEIGESHGIPILFDSAPAFGSRYRGRVIGARGNAQSFSFHATKPFTTMEGGCVSSLDAGLIRRVALLRNFGNDPAGNCVVPGLNGKMMEVCAAVGLAMLPDWPNAAIQRRENAEALSSACAAAIGGIAVSAPPTNSHPIWCYLPIRCGGRFGKQRNEVSASMAEMGVMTRKYYGACHKMPAFDVGLSLPVTEALASSVLALPVYNRMTKLEINTIANALAMSV